MRYRAPAPPVGPVIPRRVTESVVSVCRSVETFYRVRWGVAVHAEIILHLFFFYEFTAGEKKNKQINK